MDQAATFALLAKGREAWNEWAEAVTAEQRALVASGKWRFSVEQQYPGDVIPENPETRAWMSDSIAQFAQTEFADPVDFSGFVFPGTALFMNCKFRGAARFSGAKFRYGAIFNVASFAGPVDFENVEFCSEGEFMSVEFAGPALFRGARFTRGDVEPSMTGWAWFDSAKFAEAATFSSAHIGFTAAFSEAQFMKDVDFDGCSFCGLAWFSRARFDGPACFTAANFAHEPDMSEASFAQPPIWT